MPSKKAEKTFWEKLRPPSPNFSLISDNFWPTKKRPFFILISPQNDLFFRFTHQILLTPLYFHTKCEVFPVFWWHPIYLEDWLCDGWSSAHRSHSLFQSTWSDNICDTTVFVVTKCWWIWSLVEGHGLHPPSPGGGHDHGCWVRMWS